MTCSLSDTHARTNANTFTNIHTYTHSHIQTYNYTRPWKWKLISVYLPNILIRFHSQMARGANGEESGFLGISPGI